MAASEKKIEEEQGPLVSGFHYFQGSYFPTNFRVAKPFNLDYVIHFYKPKKGLTSPVFIIKILVAEVFGCY